MRVHAAPLRGRRPSLSRCGESQGGDTKLKLTALGKGLKPLQLLIGIIIHVLKDVAIAPTFRSEIPNTPTKLDKGFSPFQQSRQLEYRS
jgi:hypothetical protein